MISRTFYRDHLDQNQVGPYNALESALSRRSNTANVGNVDSQSFYDAFAAVCMDHPEYSYCAGIQASVRGGVATIAFLNSDDNLFSQKVNEAANAIYAMLNGRNDDYSKVKAIFDYLVLRVKYDFDIYDKYAAAANSGNEEEFAQFAVNNAYSFSAYGAFTTGKAVCEGISKAFKILCDLFNVPCMCTICYEKNGDQKGAPHMNNRVTIDGVDCYVDVTAALPQKTLPMVRYDLFLCTKEEVSKFFIYDTDYDGGVSRHNLFVKKGLIFRSLTKLRPFLASYDATVNRREIRFRYIGDELPEDQIGKFCNEILNKYAPSGKQWAAAFDNGYFNGLLCDSGQIKKLRA